MSRSDILKAIRDLGELHKDGLLSDEEFQREKDALLGQLRKGNSAEKQEPSSSKAKGKVDYPSIAKRGISSGWRLTKKMLQRKVKVSYGHAKKIARLSAAKQHRFEAEYRRRKKSLLLSYLLIPLALHRLYLQGISSFLLFVCTFGGFFIWWFSDLISLPRLVNDSNEILAETIILELKLDR